MEKEIFNIDEVLHNHNNQYSPKKQLQLIIQYVEETKQQIADLEIENNMLRKDNEKKWLQIHGQGGYLQQLKEKEQKINKFREFTKIALEDFNELQEELDKIKMGEK